MPDAPRLATYEYLMAALDETKRTHPALQPMTLPARVGTFLGCAFIGWGALFAAHRIWLSAASAWIVTVVLLAPVARRVAVGIAFRRKFRILKRGIRQVRRDA